MKTPPPHAQRPRLLAALAGFFAAGLACGWFSKSLLHPAAPAQPVPALTASGEPLRSSFQESSSTAADHSDFFSRVHAALSLSSAGKRERAVRSIAQELDGAEIQEALARLEKLRIPHRDEMIAQLFARWGEIDTGAAMAAAQSLSTPETRQRAVDAVLGAWIESDAAAAEAWVTALPEGLLKNSAWKSLISGVAVADPRRALSLLQARDRSSGGAEKLIQRIFATWVARSPHEAAAHAAELPEGDLRMFALRTVAEEWTRANLHEALAWADALPGQKFHTVQLGSYLPEPICAVLNAWMQKDSSGAVSWLAQLPEGEKKNALVASACTFLSQNPQPAVAMRLTGMLPKGLQQDRALQHFAHAIARWNPAAALEWVHTESDAHHRQIVMSGLLSHLSGKDLLTALELAQSFPAGSKENLITIESDGGRRSWILADPATLASWAERQPDNQEYVNRITRAWAGQDPERAGAWLARLPAEKRDTAVGEILKKSLFMVPMDNPERHFQNVERWILQLSTAEARHSAYERLGKRWIEMDAERARAWIANAPLPPDAKERLLK